MANGTVLDLALAHDPALFARQSGMEPDPWQADLHRSDALQLIMPASRQSGKSNVSSVVAGLPCAGSETEPTPITRAVPQDPDGLRSAGRVVRRASQERVCPVRGELG